MTTPETRSIPDVRLPKMIEDLLQDDTMLALFKADNVNPTMLRSDLADMIARRQASAVV